MQLPTDPIAAVTHPDPYAYYARLVEERPLYRDSGLGMWVASSAEIVTAVLESEHLRVRPAAEPVPKLLQGFPAGNIFGRLVRMTDGADQRAMKQVVIAALADLRYEEISRLTRESAEDIWPRQGAGKAARDLAGFASLLPVGVMARVLGVPQERIAQTAVDVGHFVASIAHGASSAQIDSGNAAAGRLLVLGQDLMDGNPAAPVALMQALACAARHAGIDDAQPVIANGIGMLSQTYDATAGLIGNTLLTLARRRHVRREAQRDGAYLHGVVQELLRYDPPIQNTRRFAARDCEIGKQRLLAGQGVLVLLAAANRDPAVNADPHCFNPERPEPRRFTFGHGAHACPGEALAGAIATSGIAHLLQCGIDLDALAWPAQYRKSTNTRIPLLVLDGISAVH